MAGQGTVPTAAGPPPLARLYEQAGLQAWGLPQELADAYGGDLGFPEPCVYANFVASVDGVTALGPGYPSSGSAISGNDPADRFVMGLLRACADIVLIGAGTLRATPGHLWTPRHICPAAADGYAALRRSLGRAGDPQLAVVTARGEVPAAHPAVRAGALVLTTTAGAKRLKGRLPPRCTIIDLGERSALRSAELLTALGALGGATVLTEGGPRLLGRLVADDVLDELFLTVSPVLAGRAETSRPGLVAALELLPGQAEQAELVSVRHRGSYLFLRYRLRRLAALPGRSATAGCGRGSGAPGSS
jgi:riboflavin biosynthesis pyrimidine reductase